MEEHTKLTDENIIDLNKALEEAGKDNKESRLMRDINEGKIDTSTGEGVVPTNVLVTKDPNTGKVTDIKELVEKLDDDNVDIDSILENVDEVEYKVSEDVVQKALEEAYEIEGLNSAEDIKVLTQLIQDYSEDKKVKFSQLPPTIKSMIMQSIGNKSDALFGDKHLKDQLANEFISNLSYSTITEELTETYGDINKQLTKVVKSEIGEAYNQNAESQKEMFNKELPELSKAYREEGKVEKADRLDAIINSYNDTITLEPMFNNIHNIKIKKIELEKYKKVFREFNFKYQKSKMSISDIETLVPILKRSLSDDIDTKDIIKFLVMFCKFTMNYKESNINEHVFMYYFIFNIQSLDFYKDEDNKDRLNTINTIERFITEMNK